MAQIRQAAEQQAIDGLAPGPRGPDYWWLENLNLSKRSAGRGRSSIRPTAAFPR